MDFTPHRPGGGRGRSRDWEDSGTFSDFFASLFGAAGTPAGRGGGVRITFPGSDIEAVLPVTLDDLLRGARRRIKIAEDRSLDVEIPRGARDGTVLRLAGQGDPAIDGGPPGDLYLHLQARSRILATA